MPILYVLSGPEIGRQFEVESGAVLGRADDCDVVLRHLSVSRRHARIERKRGDWRVVDLASRNGLYAGGKQQKNLYLEDGAEFRLGDLELRVRFIAVDESGGAAQDRPAPAADELPGALDETARRPVVPAPAETAANDPIDEDFEFADDTPVAAPKVARATGPEDEIRLEDPDEIRLEEPDEITLESEAQAAPVAASRAPGGTRGARAAAPVRPSAATPSVPNAGGGSRSAALDPARKALQYNRIQGSGGFLSSDLSQYPLWVRFGAVLLALVLFAGLFLIAFRTASSM